MPITKTITLYTYDELPTEKAKERAREWFNEGNDTYDMARSYQIDDAKRIGLRITSFSNRQADFINSANEVAAAIMKEHGAECETYKAAEEYDKAHHKLITEDFPTLGADDSEPEGCDEAFEAIESAFLQALITAYVKMLEADVAFQESEEQVAESLRANEYTFTETGRREDI